ncbi:MAG: phosphatidate cytidylyltransferase [Conchiformibius sp.]|nr:phosphatidate cytidylyltransferase [Conchiformibius sp.]
MNPFRNPYLIEAGYVFLGILAVLLLFGMAAAWLERRAEPPQWLGHFNAHLRLWWGITVILLLAFWFGPVTTTLLFAAVSFAALREFMTLVYRRRSDHNAIAACFYILLPLQYYFVMTDWYGMFTALIPVYAFLILPIIAALSGDTHALFERTAKIQWGAMITIFCISHVPAILHLDIKGFEGRNILLLMFMIVVVQACEVFQYFWRMLPWGRRVLMPALSPCKTVSGTVGGMVSATLLAAGLYRLTPFSPAQAAAVGLLVCVMGTAGSLVMAGIKRSYGVDNWGRLLNRHGGMLDRVDGMCFAAPVFFHIVRYYWV